MVVAKVCSDEQLRFSLRYSLQTFFCILLQHFVFWPPTLPLCVYTGFDLGITCVK